jgi:polyisoprenoid-binding protein YceI
MLFLTTRTVLPLGTWSVDPAHSSLGFAVEHLGIAIHGALTMRGVTRPVVLKAEVQGTETDPWGNERVALEVTGQLNRRDWDMTFNQVLPSGNALISNKVKLTLDISAIKQA